MWDFRAVTHVEQLAHDDEATRSDGLPKEQGEAEPLGRDPKDRGVVLRDQLPQFCI